MGLIRLLLAVSVVIAHSSPIAGMGLVGGAAAVQIFYMISGFYMALVLNEKYIGKKSLYGLFISNRILRLFPVYLVVLGTTIATQALFPVAFLKPHDTAALWTQYGPDMHVGTALLLGLSNLLLLGQDAVYFLGFGVQSGSVYPSAAFINEPMPAHLFLFIPQAWSLGVELLFYLVAPFLVRRRVRIVVGMIVMSVAVRILLYTRYGLANDPWSYRFFPSELAFFLTGSVGYRVYAFLRDTGRSVRLASAAAFWIMIVAILGYSFVPVPGKRIAIYAIAACTIPLVFAWTKDNKLDRYLGEICYPVYISHVLFAALLKSYGINWGIILAPITIAASIGLYELVDRQVDRIRQGLYAKRSLAGVQGSLTSSDNSRVISAESGTTGR
ncbi:MAG TPA: acyltransferase [Tepidisphaeraceae bacterium]|nr:acyltransferase [Tepidisphaeraceae bacterium]